jgi:hypothetical protein
MAQLLKRIEKNEKEVEGRRTGWQKAVERLALATLTDAEVENLASGSDGASAAGLHLAELEERYRGCSSPEQARGIYLEAWPGTMVFGALGDYFEHFQPARRPGGHSVAG